MNFISSWYKLYGGLDEAACLPWRHHDIKGIKRFLYFRAETFPWLPLRRGLSRSASGGDNSASERHFDVLENIMLPPNGWRFSLEKTFAIVVCLFGGSSGGGEEREGGGWTCLSDSKVFPAGPARGKGWLCNPRQSRRAKLEKTTAATT